jgi:hypothetical protein
MDAETREMFELLLKRFDSVDARFDDVDGRFDGVDARFNAVDARFDRVDARFDGVDARFNRVDARVDRVDARIGGVEDRLDVMEFRNDARHHRLVHDITAAWVQTDEHFGRLSHEIATLRQETHSNFDFSFARVDRLEIEYAALVEAVRRLERERNETK